MKFILTEQEFSNNNITISFDLDDTLINTKTVSKDKVEDFLQKVKGSKILKRDNDKIEIAFTRPLLIDFLHELQDKNIKVILTTFSSRKRGVKINKLFGFGFTEIYGYDEIENNTYNKKPNENIILIDDNDINDNFESDKLKAKFKFLDITKDNYIKIHLLDNYNNKTKSFDKEQLTIKLIDKIKNKLNI